jgi:hypothetical protein
MPLDTLPPPDAATMAPPEAAPAPAPAPAPVAFPSPLSDVVAGSLPAVTIPPVPKDGEPDPIQIYVSDRFDSLLKAGLDWHETKDQSVVLYNPDLISTEKIAAAEKAGNLNKIAPPVKQLIAAEAAAQAAPVPAGALAGAADVAAAGASAAPPAAPMPAGGLAAVPPPPPAVPNAVQTQRGKSLAPVPVSPIMPNPVPNRLAKRAV